MHTQGACTRVYSVFSTSNVVGVNFVFVNVHYRRGGRICLTDHFKPLWARNVPKFGIAHAMALGVSSVKNLTFLLYEGGKLHVVY